MPTYEYECTKCGHTFEEFQSFHDAPRARCPKCRGRVRRLIGAGAGIVFKGSGWYATDSRPKRAKSDGDTATPAPDKPATTPAGDAKGPKVAAS